MADSPISGALTLSRIGVFFAPLAFSWALMSAETPTCNKWLALSADPKLMSAGFLVMMALSMWIESPVMDLLSTSTALVRDGASLLQVRRFALMISFGASGLHALIALTPLFDLFAFGVLGTPERVADAVRIPFAIMIPWSALIGWRRFLQGVLIRSGKTRLIGASTVIRILALATTGTLLHLFSGLSGLHVAALALVASVGSEAAMVHYVSRTTVKGLLQEVSNDVPPTLKQLVGFHFPLTLAMMVSLAATPMVGRALAQQADGERAMAVWQIAAMLLFIFRAVTFALSETVIAISRHQGSDRLLFRFSCLVGCLCSAIALVLASTGSAAWVFTEIIGYRRELADAATLAVLIASPLPLFNALDSFWRGRLTSAGYTQARIWAMLTLIATLAATLVVGHYAQVDGLILAPMALNLSLLAELAVLVSIARRRGLLPFPRYS